MPNRFEVVEDDCIGCGLCSERAPENLEIPVGTSIAQVFKQPETSGEEEACLEASEFCPLGGLQASAADSSPADAQHTLLPTGDSKPVGFTPTRPEN